jgi:hypothetical protein
MKPIILALLLAGCGGIQLAPNAYEYFEDGHGKTDYYRWIVVSRDEFRGLCGFIAPSTFNGGGACAIRLQNAVAQPGDRSIYTRIPVKKAKDGRLCVVFATHDEDTINGVMDKSGEMTLAAHEVGGHCRGYNHWPVY